MPSWFLILFLSLLWHPISLIVFIVFLRDEPLVLLKKKNGRRPRRFDRAGSGDDRGSNGDDRAVVLDPRDGEYSGGTADWEFGVVLVIAHAALRKTDDLLVDEENSALLTTPASSFASSSCNCSIISPVAPPPSSMLRSSY
ncbi:hypothetical protein ACFX2J_014183 [Malus domestica]